MKNIFYGISFLLIFSACGNNSQDKSLTKSSGDSSSFSETEKVVTPENNDEKKYDPNFTLNIKLTPFVPDYPDLGESGRQLITARLNAAVAVVGFGGDGANPRFVIGPDINLLSKNVTSSAPTKYANTYEVTLIAAEVVSVTIFASYTFLIKGVGDSPAKAFINGFRDYSFNNKQFFDFLKQAQDKILNYYEKNCDAFLSQAESEAKMRNYDAAYTILNNIPAEATKCFQTATANKSKYFQMSLNTNCDKLLSSMKAELGKANDPSASGFNAEAMAFYALIDKQSSCYGEAEKTYQAYLKKLNPKAKRDWDFSMKKYQDQVARADKMDQFGQDSVMKNFEYLTAKNEMQAKSEIEGNKKLLQKYEYDELPWIRKVFHLGKYDPFDRIEK